MKLVRRRPTRVGQRQQESNVELEKSMALWERIAPFRRRVLLRKMGMPRSLYKYRAIPDAADTVARERFEDLLLNNRLWLSTVFAFNDPFEGQADYVIPYRGAELRHALEWKYRELGLSSQDARNLVNSADVADPSRLEKRAREANLRLLCKVGVCAMGTNASSPLMWAHYAHDHTGVCVQLRPVMDLRALIAHPMEYNDTFPVLDDVLEPAEKRDVLAFMRKSTDWAYEEEWRIVAQEQANSLRIFAPEAMGAVILGMRISDANKAYVLGLMDERERRFGLRPTIYQAMPARQQYRVEVRRLK